MSLLINHQSDHSRINVIDIDGQNITEITKYKQLKNTNNWNPCLPMPLSTDPAAVIITFSSNTDSIWRDWYPLDVCDYQYNSINYKNRYLFDGDYFYS